MDRKTEIKKILIDSEVSEVQADLIARKVDDYLTKVDPVPEQVREYWRANQVDKLVTKTIVGTSTDWNWV